LTKRVVLTVLASPVKRPSDKSRLNPAVELGKPLLIVDELAPAAVAKPELNVAPPSTALLPTRPAWSGVLS
jgi:hypothetical protein